MSGLSVHIQLSRTGLAKLDPGIGYVAKSGRPTHDSPTLLPLTQAIKVHSERRPTVEIPEKSSCEIKPSQLERLLWLPELLRCPGGKSNKTRTCLYRWANSVLNMAYLICSKVRSQDLSLH